MAEWRLPVLGHGADYYPEQWKNAPEILAEDLRLMKLAGCNLMSVGMFAWSALEPEEGRFDLDWLEDVLNRLHANGISVFLATPSGARPAWMSQRYPEVLRVREDGQRNLHGGRHNHCLTSPVYRQFVQRINGNLARRFGSHPAVIGWHVSNELSGECHCPLCQEAFRAYLKEHYGSLEKLNQAWWTAFWSKTYTDWNQLHSPSSVGETALHGLTLAWKRFVTAQTMDFVRAELVPLRRWSPELPVTTNLMESYGQLDYYRLSSVIDFASFDCYPRWGGGNDAETALCTAFNYDWMRSLKQKPFALMESTPSQVNWHEVCKLKKPGMHLLSSLQAVAHGADTVQYFQWRKSRGAVEKFHGAVVDHCGHEHTRTFADVRKVSEALEKLQAARGQMPQAKAAIVFDTQNRWVLEDCQGPLKQLPYLETVLAHYKALKQLGIDVDVIDETCDLTPYRLVAAPMLYMLHSDFDQRLSRFVTEGGTLVCTCLSGRVNEEDLCYLGGFPGPLRSLLGLWIEDTDALYPHEHNGIRLLNESEYECASLCEIIHTEKACVLGSYTDDFYAGLPCVTRNAVGQGTAYYVATMPESRFLKALYHQAASELRLPRLAHALSDGVLVSSRGSLAFVLNFTNHEVLVNLPTGTDLLTNDPVGVQTSLAPWMARCIQTCAAAAAQAATGNSSLALTKFF